jgi:hypothetical protein
METYIVRFYRDADLSQEVAGTVEHVGSGERAAFVGERELLERLLPRAVAREIAAGAPEADAPSPTCGRGLG